MRELRKGLLSAHMEDSAAYAVSTACLSYVGRFDLRGRQEKKQLNY
jgi:hypothetical protein